MNRPQLAQTEPLPLHPSMVWPDGTPVQAIGVGRRGPIWPVLGGSQPLGGPPPQGIPTLGGGHVQPPQGGGLPPAGGQPQQQPGGQPPQGQPPVQPQQGQPGGQPPQGGGQPQGQPYQGQPQQGQPGGQPPAPVPGPPPGYVPPADRGFPEGTPVEQMEPGQREAFYRYHMRRNQDEIRRLEAQRGDYDQVRAERDQLRQATQTEMQRAAAEAEQRGRQSGLQEAGSQIVEAYFRAAATGRLSEQAIDAQLQTINRAAFIQAGQVSQQAIFDYVNVIVGGQLQAQPVQQQAQQPMYAQGGQVPPGQPGYPPQQHTPGYPGYAPQQLPAYGQSPAQPGYGQPVPNAASFGYPPNQQPTPGQQQPYGQQPVAAAGGWPQYAPVQQQQPVNNGWQAPGMPGYGQPAYRQVPDYGQGAQPTAPQSAPEAGKAKAAERHAGRTRTTQRTAQGTPAAVHGQRA